MRTGQREQGRANAALLEPGPLIDKSGQVEMASSSAKCRVPQATRPGKRTSSLGRSQEEARLGGSLCRRLGSLGN